MTFIVSSFLIEVLGGENVDLEMPKSLKRFGERRKYIFQSKGAKKSKIAFEDE
jgi:hypothetical protein